MDLRVPFLIVFDNYQKYAIIKNNMQLSKKITILSIMISFLLGILATIAVESTLPGSNSSLNILERTVLFLGIGLTLLLALLRQPLNGNSAKIAELQEALATTTKNLEEIQEQFVKNEKMASLGSLVASVTHEINTPIGVGVTAASFLSEKTRELDKLYQQEQIRKNNLEDYLANALQSSSIILTNLERASHLIRSFKIISVDQSTDPKRDFRLKEYLEDLFVSLHPPDKHLHIICEINGDNDLMLTSYPGAFSQIIINLYMNACIHAFDDKEKGTIKIDYKKNDQTLWLCFSDNGKGMSEETIKRIYEPFFTTRRDRGGSGLGMNIVFNVVTQKLGGTIKTLSELGKGTQFILELPFEPPTVTS